jgi:2-hydroxy fatty acid dioxygenase
MGIEIRIGSKQQLPTLKMAKYPRLAEPFAFYASYHRNKVNKFIHIVCVPLLVVSAMILLMNVPFTYITFVTDVLPPNLASPLTLFYCAYYIFLSPLLGSIASVMMLSSLVLADYVFTSFSFYPDLCKVVLGIHIVSWLAQFYGHGVHEKRSPALLDNLVQALFLAPIFVMIEVLMNFGLFRDLMGEASPLIKKRLAQFAAPRSD